MISTSLLISFSTKLILFALIRQLVESSNEETTSEYDRVEYGQLDGYFMSPNILLLSVP